MASEEVMALIGKQLFGSFVRLKSKHSGEEVLIPQVTWLAIKDGSPYHASKLIEVDAVIPEMIHLFEASRNLHAMSTRRIIDFPDKREWEEVTA